MLKLLLALSTFKIYIIILMLIKLFSDFSLYISLSLSVNFFRYFNKTILYGYIHADYC